MYSEMCLGPMTSKYFYTDSILMGWEITESVINLIVAPCFFCRITSIYQPTNVHIISHKTLLKHFKTF